MSAEENVTKENDTEEKLSYFRDLMYSCHSLCTWVYDPDFRLRFSNCPNQETMEMLFSMDSMQEQIANALKDNPRPVILTNSLGLMWTAAAMSCVDKAPSLTDTHTDARTDTSCILFLGPYFIDDSAVRYMESALHSRNLSDPLYTNAASLLHTIPLISFSKAVDYSLMLFYTMTGNKLHIGDLRYIDSARTIQRREKHSAAPSDYSTVHGTYVREREMLRMVREGDLDTAQKTGQMMSTSALGRMADNPTRQLKNAILAGIVLFSRAAIEGGLAPELSMNLSDRYIRSIEAAHSVSELADINRTMQNDYVQRVHEIREHADYSSQVRDINAYIDLHLEEPLKLSDMAAALGYSTYYLSRKYQKETGMSVSEHLRERRVARAKELLLATTMPVQEISEQLCFSSPSYFIEIFRKLEGVTPAEFRSRHGSQL